MYGLVSNWASSQNNTKQDADFWKFDGLYKYRCCICFKHPVYAKMMIKYQDKLQTVGEVFDAKQPSGKIW